MAFINYTPAKSGIKPGKVKLTRTHLILSFDLQNNLKSNNVSIAYDPESQSLKLQPVEAGGLKVTDSKIQSQGFCRHFGITKRGMFPARWDENEQAIYISLDENARP